MNDTQLRNINKIPKELRGLLVTTTLPFSIMAAITAQRKSDCECQTQSSAVIEKRIGFWIDMDDGGRTEFSKKRSVEAVDELMNLLEEYRDILVETDIG